MRDDVFTEKVKNDDETSNGRKTALEFSISTNDHFSESLRKVASIDDQWNIMEIQFYFKLFCYQIKKNGD